MSARDAILARLKAAQNSAQIPLPDIGGFYAPREAGEDQAVLLQRFKTAIQAAHAEVHDTDDNHWVEDLARIAREKGVRTLLVGAGSPLAVALAERSPPGLCLVHYDRPAESWLGELFTGMDAALTQAGGAIAETGSLILRPDAREPRLMSLVPPIHFVLLDSRRLHRDLQSAMRTEAWSRGLPTNTLLISGPSKTADIQLTLAYGAHGPRELIVLVRHGEPQP